MFLFLLLILLVSLGSVSALENEDIVLSTDYLENSQHSSLIQSSFDDDSLTINDDTGDSSLNGALSLLDDDLDLDDSSAGLNADGLNLGDKSSGLLIGDSSSSDGSSGLDGDYYNPNAIQSEGDAKLSLEDNAVSGLVINLTNDNINDFFSGGILRQSYNNSTFAIVEDMSDLGILTIFANNLTINGNNHTLRNTAFCVGNYANNVTLNNFTLDLDCGLEANEYAAILIWKSNDVNIFNVNVNYVSPNNISAYAIYSLANQYRPNENLKIVNCSINFVADNSHGGRVYAVRLEYSPNAVFSNNVIDAYLPLHTIAFVGTTAVLESEFSLAVGISNCDNLNFDNNTINANVNVRPECENPTLDSVFICDSENCRFTNNRMFLYDNITFFGEANYLYALDVYRVDNMIIESNDIHVETMGGKFAAGTAYPIQITGPASDVLIRYNELFSRSNGPNIGIYSQNFNGEDFITIMNNHINVTGWAGNHSWALVAGIESQDDNDVIMNNLIEVHSIMDVSMEDNLYGISYSQSTDGTHTYKVINNTVISDGYYLSYMLDADNTTVTNNTLVRTDKYADTDYDPFKRGDTIGSETDGVRNNDFSGNRVITMFEHRIESQDNEIDGGEEFHYEIPLNVNNYTNNLNGSGIRPAVPGFPGGNPLIPNGNGHHSFSTGDYGNGGFPDLSGDDGGSLSARHFGAYANVRNSFSNHGSSSNSYNGQTVRSENSSSTSPSTNGISLSGSSRSTGSSAGASGTAGATEDLAKAYEIEEEDNLSVKSADYSQMIVICLALFILLAIGYKREKDHEEQ